VDHMEKISVCICQIDLLMRLKAYTDAALPNIRASDKKYEGPFNSGLYTTRILDHTSLGLGPTCLYAASRSRVRPTIRRFPFQSGDTLIGSRSPCERCTTACWPIEAPFMTQSTKATKASTLSSCNLLVEVKALYLQLRTQNSIGKFCVVKLPNLQVTPYLYIIYILRAYIFIKPKLATHIKSSL